MTLAGTAHAKIAKLSISRGKRGLRSPGRNPPGIVGEWSKVFSTYVGAIALFTVLSVQQMAVAAITVELDARRVILSMNNG